VPSAAPFVHALMGTVFLAISALLLVNRGENPETFVVLSVLSGAPGLYLLVAGAVSRGLELGRGAPARPREEEPRGHDRS
jgi:hypothetical protein